MNYVIEHLAERIKSARQDKKMSQRALSAKSGVPQAQISKFENAAVDLRLSSLVALFRALDLELELVPRKAVPAVQAIVRSVTRPKAGEGISLQQRPAYSLDDDEDV